MAETQKRATKLPRVGGTCDKIAPILLLIGAVLTTIGFILTFTLAPLVNGAAVSGAELIGDQIVANKLLLSQKIFYFHMPVAITSFVALAFTAYYGARFLATKKACYDLRARFATEIALLFIMCTMFSGELWERFEWGVWWTWEPRLTTYFILMLLVIAYFILRNAIDDPERRAVYASVFGIIAFVDAPICFLITRLVPSGVHPVVFRTDSGLSPDMLIPLLISMFGMFMLAFALYRLRLRAGLLEEKVETLKQQLED
ncbi:MAG: cytochrome c biogenesis protein [Raoultibacter sp.]